MLLAANMAFLAIPGIEANTSAGSRSPSQITSYFSTATSVGSLILSLLLSRQNLYDGAKGADEIVRNNCIRHQFES